MSTPAEDNIDVVDDENSGFNKGAKGGLGARRAVGPRGLSAYQFACFVAIYDAIRVMKVSNLLSILYESDEIFQGIICTSAYKLSVK